MKLHRLHRIYWKVGKIVILVWLVFVLTTLPDLSDFLVLAQEHKSLLFIENVDRSEGPFLAPTPALPSPHSCAPTPLGTITVGDVPRGIAVDPERKRVYVANYGSDSISVIDSNTNTVIQTIPDLTTANGITYDPIRNTIWVTSYHTDQVTPIQVNAGATRFTALAPIAVGNGPWGVTYDPTRHYVYVANSLADSVTVVAARNPTPVAVATLTGGFSQPFQAAANPVTGKVYVANFGSHNVTVIDGTAISKIVALDDSAQPYGIAVDETRELVYVATVGANRIAVIGPDPQRGADQFYGWAAFYRGFGNHSRRVPLRAIALNPGIGPPGDGGHLWTTTVTVDGSEANQALLVPKGWGGYFHYPLVSDLGANLAPAGGIAMDRASNRVYVANGSTPGTVTVLGDPANLCSAVGAAALQPEGVGQIDYQVFSVAALARGDVTGDGQINILDLAFVAARYGTTDSAADINGDGQVDIFDLVMAANNYGRQVR